MVSHSQSRRSAKIDRQLPINHRLAQLRTRNQKRLLPTGRLNALRLEPILLYLQQLQPRRPQAKRLSLMLRRVLRLGPIRNRLPKDHLACRVARPTEDQAVREAAEEVLEVDHLAVEVQEEALEALLEAPRQPLVHQPVEADSVVEMAIQVASYALRNSTTMKTRMAAERSPV